MNFASIGYKFPFLGPVLHKYFYIKFSRLLFIHINKNAGLSIESALNLPLYNHLTVNDYISILGLSSYSSRFVFTVVRNPWDRLVSLYHYRLKTNQNNILKFNPSFEEWVYKTFVDKHPDFYDNPIMFQSQSAWLSNSYGLQPNRILKFESLHQDFNYLCESLKISASLPHVNQTRRDPYQKYYTSDKLIAIVADLFSDDLDSFDYVYSR